MLGILVRLKEKVSSWCNCGHCTCFPDVVFGTDISGSCKYHDKRYESKRLTKYQADILLYRSVAKKGHPIVGAVMFIGVSILGHGRYRDANLP